jgi:hypothetical protein
VFIIDAARNQRQVRNQRQQPQQGLIRVNLTNAIPATVAAVVACTTTVFFDWLMPGMEFSHGPAGTFAGAKVGKTVNVILGKPDVYSFDVLAGAIFGSFAARAIFPPPPYQSTAPTKNIGKPSPRKHNYSAINL